MKFTFEGFSQSQLVKYELDTIDAAILRYFIDFKDSGKMVKKIVNEKCYYWLNYEGIIEALPILYLNKPDSVYRRLKKMVNAEILDSITVKQGGTFSYYGIGINYINLINDNIAKSEVNPNRSDKNPSVSDKNPNQTDENPEQNINLLYSSNTIKDIYVQIIDYLNKKAGTSYRYTTKETQSLINARIREKYTLEDFYKVIDNMTILWKGKFNDGIPMENYLRPKTLFGNKFESYLNQKVIAEKPKSSQIQDALNRPKIEYI